MQQICNNRAVVANFRKTNFFEEFFWTNFFDEIFVKVFDEFFIFYPLRALGSEYLRSCYLLIVYFQNFLYRQGKSRWQARFASVRLGSRAPWEQKERIVGMVKTPVEGNSIVILKMEKPVFFSDFARPICLPSSDEFIHMGAKCVTLGWSGQSK